MNIMTNETIPNHEIIEPSIHQDQLKYNLKIINKEMNLLTKLLDKHKKSPPDLSCNGFLIGNHVDERISRFFVNTTKGKHPNRPAIALLLSILECISSGPQSENSLKEAVMKTGERYGLKVTAKGSILGSNLEISSVCQILNALGILEKVQGQENLGTTGEINSNAMNKIIDMVKLLWKDGLKTLQSKKIMIDQNINNNSHISQKSMELHPNSSNQSFFESDSAQFTSSDINNVSVTISSTKVNPKPSDDCEVPAILNESVVHRNSDGQEIDFVGMLEQSMFMDFENHQEEHAAAQVQPEQSPDRMNLEDIPDASTLALDVSQQCFPDQNEVSSLIDITETGANGSTFVQSTTDPLDFYEMNNNPPVQASVSVTNRKLASLNRMWKFRSSSDSGKLNSVYASPESVLSAWGQVHFEAGALHEVEEKILRRLLEQINHPNGVEANSITGKHKLDLSCLGTRYLKRNYSTNFGDEQDGLKRSERGASGKRDIHDTALSYSQSYFSNEGNELTAFDLIEKVRKSKRQRGGKLQVMQASSNANVIVQLFDSNYTSRMKQIAQASCDNFWIHPSLGVKSVVEDDSAGEALTRKDSKRENRRNDVTVAEYCRNMSVSSSAAAGVSTNLNNNNMLSSFAASNLFVCGNYPNVTAQSLKRYSRAVELIDSANSSSCSAGLPFARVSVSGVGLLPDLSITTVEIPWKSLAEEFQVVTGDPGLGVAPAESSNAHISEAIVSPGSQKGLAQVHRRRGVSIDAIAGTSAGKHLENAGETSKSQSIIKKNNVDVVAPSFRETVDIRMVLKAKVELEKLESKSRKSEEIAHHEEEDEEDISDETMLAKHEGVLRAMREKWALIQSLRQETRKESLHAQNKHLGSTGFQSPHNNASRNSASSRHFKSYTNNSGHPNAFISAQKTKEELEKTGSFNTIDNKEQTMSSNFTVAHSQVTTPIVQNIVKKRGRPPKFPRSQSLSSNSYNYNFNLTENMLSPSKAVGSQLDSSSLAEVNDSQKLPEQINFPL